MPQTLQLVNGAHGTQMVAVKGALPGTVPVTNGQQLATGNKPATIFIIQQPGQTIQQQQQQPQITHIQQPGPSGLQAVPPNLLTLTPQPQQQIHIQAATPPTGGSGSSGKKAKKRKRPIPGLPEGIEFTPPPIGPGGKKVNHTCCYLINGVIYKGITRRCE